ncbi:MAG: transporter substrate-binding domain-containing protein [Anaerolineae bacterium]|nr:transporter substrate-binding domain-containing protein [Anaerolineae bacterium]
MLGISIKRVGLIVVGVMLFFLAACKEEEPVPGPMTQTSEAVGEVQQEAGLETADMVATPTRTPAPVAMNETPIPANVSESALKDIRENQLLRVGILYNYYPLAYLADNGQVKGYEADLLRKIAEYWEVEIEFVQVTRQTRFQMLAAGQVDIVAGAVPHRREFEQFAEFTGAIFYGGYVVAVPNDSGLDIASALVGPVAVLDTEALAVISDWLSQLGVASQIRVVTGMDEALSAMTTGEITAVIARRERLLEASEVDETVDLLDIADLEEPYAFAVRRGDTALRELINLTLAEMITANEVGRAYSANFFGLTANHPFPERLGDPVYTFDSFPDSVLSRDSVIDRIRRGEALRVAGLDLAEEPATFDSRPIFDGYNRAVINEMARRWNVPVTELSNSAGQAGLDLMAAGGADLVMGIRPDRPLIGSVAFSPPYYQVGLQLIHIQGVDISGVEALNFKPVAVIEPLDIGEDIIRDNNLEASRLELFTDREDAFEQLLGRAIYGVIGDEYATMLMMQGDDRITMVDELYRPKNYVIALPRDDADFIALVNFTLQDMERDGTLDRLREQYFSPYRPEGSEFEDLLIEFWPGDGGFLGVGG